MFVCQPVMRTETRRLNCIEQGFEFEINLRKLQPSQMGTKRSNAIKEYCCGLLSTSHKPLNAKNFVLG